MVRKSAPIVIGVLYLIAMMVLFSNQPASARQSRPTATTQANAVLVTATRQAEAVEATRQAREVEHEQYQNDRILAGIGLYVAGILSGIVVMESARRKHL